MFRASFEPFECSHSSILSFVFFFFNSRVDSTIRAKSTVPAEDSPLLPTTSTPYFTTAALFVWLNGLACVTVPVSLLVFCFVVCLLCFSAVPAPGPVRMNSNTTISVSTALWLFCSLSVLCMRLSSCWKTFHVIFS